jgi:hypothetical protein
MTAVGVSPEVSGQSEGFKVTKGEATTVNGMSVTPVTVVATENTGNRDTRIGQVIVSLPDSDRTTTVVFSQRTSDIEEVTA